MKATVGGVSYEFNGRAWGTQPPWACLHRGDSKMTRAEFLALPEDQTKELIALATTHAA